MLEVDIYKDYGDFVLDVDFIFDSQSMGLLGPSGSGKSQTLKCIAGIMTPDQGRIVLDGEVLYDSELNINKKPQDRNIGYLFQNYSLFPNMTVYENIAVGLKDRDDRDKKIKTKISEMRLTGLEDHYPSQISGGQSQRVALARMLINDPKIILLDEPFSALDEYLKWEIESEVTNILNKYNIPTVLVSHSRYEVYRMCDKLSVLDNGKSNGINETSAIFTNPSTYTEALITGCKNYSKIESKNGHTVAVDWNIKVPIDDEYPIIGVRSHNIKISKNKSPYSYSAEIKKIIEDLFDYVIIVQTPGADSSIRIDMPKRELDYRVGDQVYITIDPKHIMKLRG